MGNVLSKLFSSAAHERRMCEITAIRGAGSYSVRDDLGRGFIVSGAVGFEVSQKVTVVDRVITGDGLQLKQIRVVSV